MENPYYLKIKVSATRYKRVWYRVNAKVTIGPGFIHRTGLGGLLIPHPPIVNRLLRMGLPGHLCRNLTFAHEFAHFQTAPVLFVYMLVMFMLFHLKDRSGMADIFVLPVSIQAAWELMSEGVVVLEDTPAYHNSYRGITGIPRLIFWAAGGLLAAAGWVVVLHQ